MTLNKAIIDFGKFDSVPGLAYVALSRIKKIENVLIKFGFDADRIINIKESEYVAQFENETEILINNTTDKCLEEENESKEIEMEMEYE
jgi:hypothetical protein